MLIVSELIYEAGELQFDVASYSLDFPVLIQHCLNSLNNCKLLESS